MAIDNRLQVFNEEGQSVDYDILASDVKFLPDGKDLPTKLAEMQDEIDQAGQGDGTVTGVKVGSDTYEPTEGVVDLSTPFSGKVDKVNGKGLSTNDYTDVDKTKLQNLPTADELTQQMGTKANDNAVVKSISVNGTQQSKDQQGNVNIQVQAGDQVSVIQPDPANGTFIIRVGSTDYTINLNHTHENMAKLVVCEEIDLPSTLDPATIYAITDSGETEIEKLIIRGMEFAGGYAPGTPAITKPSGATINLGENSGSGVSKDIEIKANSHITGDLTVGLAANSDLSFDTTNLPSGVTYNSGAGTLTIAQATAMQGVNITIIYSGSGAAEIEGGIVISGGGLSSPKSVVVVVVPAPIALKAVKFTGTQWAQTDYNVNVNTKVSMRLKFTENANTIAGDNSNKNYYFLTAYTLSSASKQFAFYAYKSSNTESQLLATVPTTPPTAMNIPRSSFLTDDSLFEVGLQSMKFTPNGGTAITTSIGATATMDRGPLTIGLYHSSSGTDSIFNWYDLTIYELTITENDVVKRHYTPVTRDGVPGLLDSETGHFMSSKTSTEFVAIPLT